MTKNGVLPVQSHVPVVDYGSTNTRSLVYAYTYILMMQDVLGSGNQEFKAKLQEMAKHDLMQKLIALFLKQTQGMSSDQIKELAQGLSAAKFLTPEEQAHFSGVVTNLETLQSQLAANSEDQGEINNYQDYLADEKLLNNWLNNGANGMFEYDPPPTSVYSSGLAHGKVTGALLQLVRQITGRPNLSALDAAGILAGSKNEKEYGANAKSYVESMIERYTHNGSNDKGIYQAYQGKMKTAAQQATIPLESSGDDAGSIVKKDQSAMKSLEGDLQNAVASFSVLTSMVNENG
ncbi:MAG: hypothetical protein SP1CHLAM54_17570 [Chlamydiia bacterium]|nr:hypothetical protein [Chlamydiia bacterium]MCH9616645.1 hypothetical protein [Chlamydiia bacterium]MCH9629375.1 hypothetical protein [Chlamydiia bacterium]